MKRLERILTAVDFSEPARAAFDHALALARTHDAELLVVQAVPTDRPFRWEARKRTDMMTAVRAAAEQAGVRHNVSIQQGDPARVILLHARARGADLIVLGTNERTGLDLFRLGSVAETVALQATQPVLVVPASKDGAVPDAPPSFKSIVVAVDLGEGSRAAVERAMTIAGDDSRVTVVHVVAGGAAENVARYAYRLMEPEYQRQLARDAWRKLPEIVPSGTASRKVHTRVVAGEPSAEISRVATEADADLILVGVTPRSALGRRIFRSTAAHVIRAAGRPVLALPAGFDRTNLIAA